MAPEPAPPAADRGSDTEVPGGPAVDRPRRPSALSPSRANDYKKCPLLYRFRAIDRLPEPPSPEAARGTLVHAVLERMFGWPGPERTVDAAVAQVEPLWAELVAEREELAGLIAAGDLPPWLASAEDLVRTYFRLENPQGFTPEGCEVLLEVETAGEVPLRGYLDRLDVAPTGEVRVVDYKTGRSPGEFFEASALYQLKFYALMLYRLRQVVPAQLKLLYLADGEPLTYSPTEDELIAFERGLTALWRAITRSTATGDFRPRQSRLCQWCPHRDICPEFGGVPPAYPLPVAAAEHG